MATPFEQHVGVDAVLARQARHRHAGLASLLRQTPLEIDRIVRPPLAAAGLCSCVHDGSRQIAAGATLALSPCYVQTVLSRRLRLLGDHNDIKMKMRSSTTSLMKHLQSLKKEKGEMPFSFLHCQKCFLLNTNNDDVSGFKEFLAGQRRDVDRAIRSACAILVKIQLAGIGVVQELRVVA